MSFRRGAELGHYNLHAFVVMPNHVHILGRTGETFWQRESYDHWVRNQAEFERIGAYIENNPVRAGLVARASDYPWSSAADVPRPG